MLRILQVLIELGYTQVKQQAVPTITKKNTSKDTSKTNKPWFVPIIENFCAQSITVEESSHGWFQGGIMVCTGVAVAAVCALAGSSNSA